MFKAITSFTPYQTSTEAVCDLTTQCRQKLGIYRPTAGILYCSLSHNEERLTEVINGLNAAFPFIQLAGCTVIAGFTDESGYQKEGYFLTLLSSDSIEINVCVLKSLSKVQKQNRLKEKFKQTLERTCPDISDTRLCLIFPGYTGVDGDNLAHDLHSVLPEDCLVIGGSATDYWTEKHIENFHTQAPPIENTRQFTLKDNVLSLDSDSMPCLLFSGPVELETGYAYGWSDTGRQYQAKTKGSRFVEIDGMQPIDFIKKNNHPIATSSGATDYAFWIHEPGKEAYMRDIFHDFSQGILHTNSQSLPDNFKISFSFPDEKHILKEYAASVAEFKQNYDLILSFTCCSHVPLLKNFVEQEHSCHLMAFPRTALISSYVFGEFGPPRGSTKSILHSCSSITLCIRESEQAKEYQPDHTGNDFLHKTIRTQRTMIESLEKQLQFFENNKNNKKKKFTEDCLGMILNHSSRSMTGYADQLSRLFKEYYDQTGQKAPYPISRNRIIDHFKAIKETAKVKFTIPD